MHHSTDKIFQYNTIYDFDKDDANGNGNNNDNKRNDDEEIIIIINMITIMTLMIVKCNRMLFHLLIATSLRSFFIILIILTKSFPRQFI